MSDTELYQDSHKDRLTKLLTEQAELKSKLEQLELEWFECQEQIEEITEAAALS